MASHVSTLQRSIDAIVAEARRPVRSELPARSDAVRVLHDRAEFWRALAEEQGRPFAVVLPEHGVPVPLASDDLADLVDVLIDNVFLHTPDGTGFRVSAELAGDLLHVEVADAGPGFAGPRDVDGPRRVGSTGLGLDIARRTVLGCGGTLSTGAAPEGGALVVMELPIRS
jgi:signal transduction histidine kinase